MPLTIFILKKNARTQEFRLIGGADVQETGAEVMTSCNACYRDIATTLFLEYFRLMYVFRFTVYCVDTSLVVLIPNREHSTM